MSDTVITDPLSGQRVIVAPDRQGRPNLPDEGCPFCVGGREAAEPYDVRWFTNRWPSLGDGRAEVVLFSPDHAASLGGLPTEQIVRVVELWSERTAELGARDDVDYVLIFENRGEEIGATIRHPHGQIYAFGEVPPVPATELARAGERGSCALCDELKPPDSPGARLVASAGNWRAWVPAASAHPYGIVVAPTAHVGALPELTGQDRHDFAIILGEVLSGLDHLFDEETPYMSWIHQRPTDGSAWPWAHLHVEVAPFRRAMGVNRYVAGAELGSGIMINSVAASDAAAHLRAAPTSTVRS
ncbi:MAG TPA: galactose-1-phosphate uridylyltransferase [Acidimicrobiales bacterium]|nr:galactose-1-phosphate uridylyltransferase [Acidimicrobiales bacterium]